MLEEKLIIIGCDDGVTMVALLNQVKEIPFFTANIVSATRSSDLITIVQSMKPDLIIFCFHNHQMALSDFNISVKKPEIPILCIFRKFENGMLNQHQRSIIFTYPHDHLSNHDYFNSTINSIFLLSNKTAHPHITSNSTTIETAPTQVEHSPNLGRYALELDQKVEMLLKVKNRISNLYAGVDDPIKAELTSIVNSIKQASHEHKLWDDFKLYFEQINPYFLSYLTKKFPLLTPIDLKYCCYLLMNMSNDDIKRLLGINQESVRTHKYRLKKKMLLPKEQDLQSFLRSVG